VPRRPHRSNQAAKLFAALAAHPDAWQHGYDLMRQTRLASGTLYPLLIRLHEAGYLEARRADVASRTFVVDIANRSLLSAFLPMQSLRAAGMHLIGSVGPLYIRAKERMRRTLEC